MKPTKRPTFEDLKARTTEYSGWSNSSRLTPQQEKTKRQALGAIPAPPCKEYGIATCYCPCNLATVVDGQAIGGASDIARILPEARPEDLLRLEVYRGSARHELVIPLERMRMF